MGHMEKQETEMKWKLEMETGNGNWKRKLETETRKRNHWCNIFFIVCLVIYSSILLSNRYGTGFMSHACFAITPVLCFVITVFSVIEYCSCCKQCCNVFFSHLRRGWARD